MAEASSSMAGPPMTHDCWQARMYLVSRWPCFHPIDRWMHVLGRLQPQESLPWRCLQPINQQMHVLDTLQSQEEGLPWRCFCPANRWLADACTWWAAPACTWWAGSAVSIQLTSKCMYLVGCSLKKASRGTVSSQWCRFQPINWHMRVRGGLQPQEASHSAGYNDRLGDACTWRLLWGGIVSNQSIGGCMY